MKKIFTTSRLFKLFYFLKFSAIGVFYPYMALYFTAKGLNGIQMGLVLSMLPAAKIFVQPFFSLISDIYDAHRVVMFLSCLGTGLAVLGLYLANSFFPILLVMIIFSALDTPAEPEVNALALDYLEKKQRHNDFGSLRLWGSVGFALTSFVTGWLVTGETMIHLPFFYAIICLSVAFLTLFMPVAGKKERQLTWVEGIKILPERPVLALFLLGVVLTSAAMNITVQYLAIYLEGLNALGWLIGLTIALQAIIEVPLMGSTPRIIQRLGLKNTLLLGVLLMPLRYIIFFFVRDAWLVMPTQVFHAMAIISIQVVAVSFVDRLVPNEWRATGQGLLSTSFRGVGPSLGLLLSGFAFQWGGIMGVWGVCLVFSLCAAFAMNRALNKSAARQAFDRQCSTSVEIRSS